MPLVDQVLSKYSLEIWLEQCIALILYFPPSMRCKHQVRRSSIAGAAGAQVCKHCLQVLTVQVLNINTSKIYMSWSTGTVLHIVK